MKGTFKLYPKLKAFYELRADKTSVFQYGYCLKAFPDEPITPIVKEEGPQQGNFFSNWFVTLHHNSIFIQSIYSIFFQIDITNRLNSLTNPLDTTDLTNKGEMRLKQ